MESHGFYGLTQLNFEPPGLCYGSIDFMGLQGSAMHDLRFSVYLARNGWAVYELATRRVVELDGVPQAGLRFALAEKAARLLNSAGWEVGGSEYSSPAKLHS
jgi:hypothetical protein